MCSRVGGGDGIFSIWWIKKHSGRLCGSREVGEVEWGLGLGDGMNGLEGYLLFAGWRS